MGEEASLYDRWKESREPAELMARAAKLVLDGARPMRLARVLSVPYPRACRIFDQVMEGVVGRLDSRYTPEVLATLKADLSDTLVEEVAVCRARGRKDTRAYVPLNSAAKQLSQMHGLNAPTRTVNVEVEGPRPREPRGPGPDHGRPPRPRGVPGPRGVRRLPAPAGRGRPVIAIPRAMTPAGLGEYVAPKVRTPDGRTASSYQRTPFVNLLNRRLSALLAGEAETLAVAAPAPPRQDPPAHRAHLGTDPRHQPRQAGDRRQPLGPAGRPVLQEHPRHPPRARAEAVRGRGQPHPAGRRQLGHRRRRRRCSPSASGARWSDSEPTYSSWMTYLLIRPPRCPRSCGTTRWTGTSPPPRAGSTRAAGRSSRCSGGTATTRSSGWSWTTPGTGPTPW